MITSPLTATVVTSPLTATVVTPPQPRSELEELLEAHGLSRYAAALLEAGYETIPDVATALDGDLVDDCGMKKPHARRLLAVCVEKSGVSLPPAGEIMIRASPSPPVTALGLARARSQLPGEPGRDNFRLEIDGRDIGREGNGAGNDGGEEGKRRRTSKEKEWTWATATEEGKRAILTFCFIFDAFWVFAGADVLFNQSRLMGTDEHVCRDTEFGGSGNYSGSLAEVCRAQYAVVLIVQALGVVRYSADGFDDLTDTESEEAIAAEAAANEAREAYAEEQRNAAGTTLEQKDAAENICCLLGCCCGVSSEEDCDKCYTTWYGCGRGFRKVLSWPVCIIFFVLYLWVWSCVDSNYSLMCNPQIQGTNHSAAGANETEILTLNIRSSNIYTWAFYNNLLIMTAGLCMVPMLTFPRNTTCQCVN
jgi:hypothetical protein